MIYLDFKAIIPFFLVWLGNIVVGYATVGSNRTPKDIRPKLKRMKSMARRQGERLYI